MVSAVVFHFITDPFIKFDPLAVIVKPGPPAFAVAGDIDKIAGNGLFVLVFASGELLLHPRNTNKVIMTVSDLSNFIMMFFF